MLVAFLGADGISAPTYAALLAAAGFSALGQSTRIVSPRTDSDSRFLTAPRIANSIHEVESGSAIEATLKSSSRECDRVIIVGCLGQAARVSTYDCRCIVVVEPTRAHELAALSAIRSMPSQAVILISGNADHSLSIGRAAAIFDKIGVEVLPAAVPALNRRETDALADGRTSSRIHRIGLQLALALIDPRGHRTRGFDNRGIGDRLRELADDIEAIEEGAAPTDEDLLSAPRLTGWARLPQQVPVIAGLVAGHPSVEGFMTTSQVFASDGRSWARTLSRWYRLDDPAIPPQPAPVH